MDIRKFIKLNLAVGAVLCSFTACEDVFVTNPDDIINVKDYIHDDEEMYKGFMGILTKLQQAGDHAIFLTDTRSDFLEVTGNAPLELQQIYNYDSTDGNSYANPAPYYAIVVACNDYMDKMREYREKVGSSMDEKNATNFKNLVSLTLRLKVWAYLKLGSIYGEAVWFDDPLEERVSLNDTTVFSYCKMPSIVEHCLDLLDHGVCLYNDEVIPANLDIDWAAWFNEETASTNYVHWQYMVPEWLSLRCELLTWRGTTADYEWIKDQVLTRMFNAQNGKGVEIPKDATSVYYYYSCNIPIQTTSATSGYGHIFFNEEYSSSGRANLFQLLSGIMYDYSNKQRNRLVEYFGNEVNGKYYLKPSTYALKKYASKDLRGLTQKVVLNVLNGDTCFTKYYYLYGEYLRTRIAEIQPAIPLYRAHDYHFWVAEAENHLGNWYQSAVVLNNGVSNEFVTRDLMPANWDARYKSWFGVDDGSYGDIGIAGCMFGNQHPLPTPKDAGYALSAEERIKAYDLAILDEALSEYTGEGRSYAYLCRMAERYGANVVADRVCPKYPADKQAKVRAAIENGGYWVKWDLKISDILAQKDKSNN